MNQEDPPKLASSSEEELLCLRREMDPCVKLILPHINALGLRRSQLVTKDHYGNQVTNEWESEMDYFILRNLLGDRPNALEEIKTAGGIKSLYHRLIFIIDLLALNSHRIATAASAQSEGSDLINWESLEATEFEDSCRRVLDSLGWRARRTGGSGDQGVDIIAECGSRKLVIQCKRYVGSVGNKAVQEIIAGREYEKANEAAVVTTGRFTKGAIQLASASSVKLLHPKEIPVHYSIDGVQNDIPKRRIEVDEALRQIFLALHECEIEARSSQQNSSEDDLGDDEDLYQQALDVLKSTRRASTSMIQRRLRIGYNQAARIMDLMEQKGIVGPENGSSPREILVDLDTL